MISCLLEPEGLKLENKTKYIVQMRSPLTAPDSNVCSVPFYSADNISIYNNDFLRWGTSLADERYDLIIADPPYGDNNGYGRNAKQILNNENETINYYILDICYRLLKCDSNLYLFSNWKFAYRLKIFAEWIGYKLRMEIVMIKKNYGMGYGFRNQYEKCLVLEKGEPKYNRNDFSNVQYVDYIRHNDNTHPHEKDVSLIAKIIQHSSQPGDLILDPTIGSGSTLVACKKMDRRADGCELDSHWCNIAKERLSQY